MEQKKMPSSGFCCRKDFEGEKDFDEFYLDRELRQVATKTGEGDEDFIIQTKEVVTKRPIAEVINSQANDVGIESYLRRVQQEGGEVPNIIVTDEIQDFENCPEDLAALAALGENAKSKYAQLDPELTKGLSIEDFLSSLTKQKLEDYFASKIKAVAENAENGEGDTTNNG